MFIEALKRKHAQEVQTLRSRIRRLETGEDSPSDSEAEETLDHDETVNGEIIVTDGSVDTAAATSTTTESVDWKDAYEKEHVRCETLEKELEDAKISIDLLKLEKEKLNEKISTSAPAPLPASCPVKVLGSIEGISLHLATQHDMHYTISKVGEKKEIYKSHTVKKSKNFTWDEHDGKRIKHSESLQEICLKFIDKKEGEMFSFPSIRIEDLVLAKGDELQTALFLVRGNWYQPPSGAA
jgi:hypothetical protein